MATTDDLIIAIRADVGRLESQLREVDRQLNNTRDTSNQATSALKNMALGLVSVGGAVAGLQKLVDVNRQFAILTAGLETATGSAQSAGEAFAVLEQFASNTPYSLSQAVDGFTKLVNLGLTPSEAALKSYGDTAAALGKDLSQMIEAVADAATGEFERLKEFGIKAKNNGDTISFTFRGVTETVKNNAAEIEQHLIKLGQVNFDGAMQKRMDTLDGAISNLSDSWDAFFRQLGDSGATDVLSGGFKQLGNAISDVTKYIKNIPINDFEDGLGLVSDTVLLLAGYMATKLATSLALSTQEFIKNIAAQSALRLQTLAVAEADAAATGISARRAIVEKELALDQLNRARATTAAALSTQQSAIVDLEAAKLQSRLALGTQNATAANLARSLAADKVTQSTLTLNAAMAAESAALGRATAAHTANTAAITAQATASTALAEATTAATVAGRASASMLTALGGPIGAVITGLGLAATAWFVFGDSAETATEKALNAGKKLKQTEQDDSMKVQTDAWFELTEKIKTQENALDSMSGRQKLQTQNAIDGLKKQRAEIEKNIETLELQKVLDDFLKEKETDTLGKFGVKRDKPTADVDEKGKQQEQKKLEQLKKAAQDFLGNIAESNMTESQLDEKHFNESLSQLKKHLNDGLITREQFKKAEIDLNEAFNNKMLDSLVSQYEKEDALELERQQKEDEQRAAKVEQINAFIKDTENAGKTQLELMDAQHAEKMDKHTKLMEGEEIYKEQLRQAALDAEAQHQAKRLDLMLGTGSKIQDMNKAFQKGQLQGTLAFFAADFGGMSQHSRKMFELTKAARLADAAMNIPSTVMAAVKHGTEMGGWPVGAAMGAAALASQLGQLRAIQSASFGGGSSGGGGAGGGAPSASSAPEAQAPIQQRFVNINLSGSDNSMYSKSSVRDLITRINDEVKDGAVLRVV